MTLPISEVVVRGAPSFQAFNRSSTVTVGTTQVRNVGRQRGLDVEFTIKTSLKPNQPNTCDLKIWDLTADTRKALEQSSQTTKSIAAAPGSTARIVPVKIEAGFVGQTSTVFQGEMRSAQTAWDGDDCATELNTGDSDDAIILQRISKSVAGGSSATSVLKILLGQMGCGLGNLLSREVQGVLTSATLFQKGAMLKGNAADHVADICASVGLEFSIQGGAAQFLSLGQPLGGDAYELAPGAGLIGSPSVDTKGILSFCSFILPGIRAGGPIVIDSENGHGLYRIIALEISGSTAGNDWYCKGEAQRYGAPAPAKKKKGK